MNVSAGNQRATHAFGSVGRGGAELAEAGAGAAEVDEGGVAGGTCAALVEGAGGAGAFGGAEAFECATSSRVARALEAGFSAR